MNYYIGIDVGHTKSKAGILDADGNLLWTASAETPFEDDIIVPELLWKCVVECLNKLLSESDIDPAVIKGIACTGHGNGMYAVDTAGKPYDRAYAATTDMGMKSLSEWKEKGKDREAYPILMQEMWTGQPLAILADMKKYEPEHYQSIEKVMLCKDFINYCLTGVISTDYTDASAAGIMNNRTGSYDDNLFKLFSLQNATDKLPPLHRSVDVAGYVTAKAARETGLKEGTIVAGGMFDVAASLLGAGVFEPGICGIISGTWGINAVISEEPPKRQEFLQCTRFVDGREYLFIESAPTSSVNLEWLLKNVFPDTDYEEANRIAGSYSATDVKLLYLPYLYGNLRGMYQTSGFLNLTEKDSKNTMIRAVYEGVALGHKKQVEVLQKSGVSFEKIIFTGGAANSKVWCQIFADVLGKEIFVPKDGNAGILGAGMTAAVAAGEYEDYQKACSSMKGQYIVYFPNLKETEAYALKYQKFCSL